MKTMFVMIAVLVLAGLGIGQTAKEKKDLLALVKKDKAVADTAPQDTTGYDAKLAKELTIRRIDLNRDGSPEYIATLHDPVLCGAHENCPNWVFRKTRSGYDLLLSTGAQRVTTERTSSGRFRDLRASGSDSATESSYSIYKFDGTAYKAVDCFTIDNSGKRPKTSRVKCQE